MTTDPFSPVTIGPLAAKNRLMRSVTNDHLGNRDAAVSDAQIDMKIALVGGIYSRETIAKALTAADIAAMGRTLLTQPDFVRKLKDGEADTSRCIRCNKCFGLYKTKYERCIFGPVNPKLVETFSPGK